MRQSITRAIAVAMAFAMAAALSSCGAPPATQETHFGTAAGQQGAHAPPLASARGTLPANRVLLQAFDEQVIQNAARAVGGQVVDRIAGAGVAVIALPGAASDQAIAALASQPGVVYAERDGEVTVAGDCTGPNNDPQMLNQWGVCRIEAPAAWSVGTSSAGIRVAVLDTGIDQSHEDLIAKVSLQRNWTTSNANDVEDRFGHGTHVGGIAGAVTNNAVGVAGVGYQVALLNGKVLSDSGSGYVSWVASGIRWAADNGAHVINLSLAATVSSRTLLDAVRYAHGKGCLLVAAAGNAGTTSRHYPAAYDEVLSVAATDSADLRASFSSYGANWVKVAAPGVNILATLPDHPHYLDDQYRVGIGYGVLNGTSMAAPMVAGSAALLWLLADATPQSPDTTARDKVQNAIQSHCDWVPGTYVYDGGNAWMYGRVNVGRAANALVANEPVTEPTPTPTPEPTPKPKGNGNGNGKSTK